MNKMLKLVLITAFALPVFADVQVAVTSTEQIQALDRQMSDLLQEREAVLSQMRDDNMLAPLGDRVEREAEYAQMQEQYEIQLLEMMIEYYGLTENEELRTRAEVNLEHLRAPAATGTLETDAQNRAREATGEVR